MMPGAQLCHIPSCRSQWYYYLPINPLSDRAQVTFATESQSLRFTVKLLLRDPRKIFQPVPEPTLGGPVSTDRFLKS